MSTPKIIETATTADDRILPLTRAVAWLVIPFLVAAFVILYVDGRHTADWFAWAIDSRLTTALMGAGYLGGAYFFLRVALGPGRQHIHLGAGYTPDASYVAQRTAVRWHEVQVGYWPVTTFTVAMLLATLLHWDKFLTGNWPFWVWLVLYIVTPLLVPFVWWRNRPADPRTPRSGERLVPGWMRGVMGFAGGFLLVLSVAAFIRPDLITAVWPWTLSSLTARVMAGWHALLGVGALTLGAEVRWSGWIIPMQSIAIWMGLMLLALRLHQAELGAAGLSNWYTVFVLCGLLGLTAVWLLMRGREPLP